jgi:mRNA interferase MazF
MITSAKNSDWLLDVPISDLHEAGLASQSIVRMKLFTLDNRLIIRQAGKLSNADRQSVNHALNQLVEFE